jgi:DivIVA domain-containing protein
MALHLGINIPHLRSWSPSSVAGYTPVVLLQRRHLAPDAAAVRGAQARRTTFLRRNSGYEVTAVDRFLSKAADEIDRDTSPADLRDLAKFNTRGWSGYEVDSVDWFLDELLREPQNKESQRAGRRWFDGPLANHFTRLLESENRVTPPRHTTRPSDSDYRWDSIQASPKK